MAQSSPPSTVTLVRRLLLLLVVMLVFAAWRVTATYEQPRDMQHDQQQHHQQLYHQQQHDQQQHHQQQQPPVQLTRRSLIAEMAAPVPAAAAVANTTSEEEKERTGWPVYGNWCGPKHGSGTPIDEMDACCKAHDNCYDSTGVYLQCGCDQQVVRCLSNITTSLTLGKRAMPLRRAAISVYFNNTVCKCSKASKLCRPVKTCAMQCPALG